MALDRYKIFIKPVFWAVAITVSYLLFQGIFTTEEARVRKFILRGRQAAESKNILACAGMISTKYHDKYGNDRQSLIYLGRRVFDYYKTIFVHIASMDIKLDDSKKNATVELGGQVVFENQQNNKERIFEGESGRGRIKLIKEGRSWLLLEIEFVEPITVMGQHIA
jgi:hypothetical protein